MKKRAISMILCAFILLSLHVTAMAVDQTETNTTITKTIEDAPSTGDSGGGGDDDDTPSNTSSYEISIPASFSLDDGDSFDIIATKVELSERQELRVFVDYERTFAPDGYFYLKNTTNILQKIPCAIYCGVAGLDYWQAIIDPLSGLAAMFTQRSGTTSDYCGSLKIVTAGAAHTAGSTSVAGTYSGTIYFTIGIVDF